jgi:hypothetical protein
MKTLMPYWPVAAFVLQFLTAWACWSFFQLARSEVGKLVDAARATQQAINDDIEARVSDHHDKLTDHSGQIREIRADINALPTKADLERVAGEVKSVGVDARAANAGIQRLESYFLKRGVENAS